MDLQSSRRRRPVARISASLAIFLANTVRRLYKRLESDSRRGPLRGETVLVWASLAIAVAGTLLGLWVRLSALAVATFLTILASSLITWSAGWTLAQIAASTFYFVVLLQLMYLTGAFVRARLTDG